MRNSTKLHCKSSLERLSKPIKKTVIFDSGFIKPPSQKTADNIAKCEMHGLPDRL